MKINSIQSILSSNISPAKQFNKTSNNCNTNPLTYDTFTSSVSF